MISPRRLGRVRRRRAFTLIEVLVAAALAVGFGSIVAQALVSASKASAIAIEKASLAREVRVSTDLTVRFLRGARPKGMCADPRDVALSACRRVAETGPAVLYASPSEIWFYSYATDAGTSTTNVLRPPDCVQIVFSNSLMQINRFAPTALATYTTPAWSSVASTVHTLDADSGLQPFTYVASDGSSIATGSGLGSKSCSATPTAADLSRIALVRLNISATSTRSQVSAQAITAFVELPSARLDVTG